MVKAGNIFLAEYSNYYGEKKRHYFYCIYSQEEDINNNLNEDVIGLMITSNKKMDYIIENKNDYNVKIILHSKNVYVCCDKIFRFNKNEIKTKGGAITKKEKKEIDFYYKKFIKESLRQLKENEEITTVKPKKIERKNKYEKRKN